MKLPYFKWYPKDCDTDENVRMMTDAEFGFYVRCLNHAWINDGLPPTVEGIARALGRDIRTVKKFWKRVGNCFTTDGDRCRSLRQEAERKHVLAFSLSRQNSAKSRWENKNPMRTQSVRTEDALRTHHIHMQREESSGPLLFPEEVALPGHEPLPPEIVRPKRAARLKIETLPEDWLGWTLRELHWDVARAESVWLQFHDYWVAKSRDGAKLDWLATWRNWCRNDSGKNGQGGSYASRKKLEAEEYQKSWRDL